MRRLISNIALTVFLATSLHGQNAVQAAAEHRDYALKLDQLFGVLHQATGPEAKAAETGIWLLWSRNGAADAVATLENATAAMQVQDIVGAMHLLDGLVQAHPEFAEGWNRRATLYYMEGRFENSLSDIEHVLALEPRHFGALSGKGMVLVALGRNAEAATAFKDALAINPNMAGAKASLEMIEKIEPPL